MEPEEGVFEGGRWDWFALAVTSLSPVSSVPSPPGLRLPLSLTPSTLADLPASSHGPPLLSGPTPCSSITPALQPLLPGPSPPHPLASPGPPSAPQELWFEVQGSALMLHWRLPQELGGRGDLLFNVVCRECGSRREPGGGSACRRCPDEVHFDPRQRGLTESRVLVGGLRAHVPYILEVQAVNGVSELSPDPPQAAAINVSTSHAGEPCLVLTPYLAFSEPLPHWSLDTPF